MRLSPLSQVRSAITGKNRFPVTIRQIQGPEDTLFGTRRTDGQGLNPLTCANGTSKRRTPSPRTSCFRR